MFAVFLLFRAVVLRGTAGISLGFGFEGRWHSICEVRGEVIGNEGREGGRESISAADGEGAMGAVSVGST